MHIGKELSIAGSTVSKSGTNRNAGNCLIAELGKAAVKSSVREKINAPIFSARNSLSDKIFVTSCRAASQIFSFEFSSTVIAPRNPRIVIAVASLKLILFLNLQFDRLIGEEVIIGRNPIDGSLRRDVHDSIGNRPNEFAVFVDENNRAWEFY